jgi:putative Mg2+ transporter-C (MgtC) family protein
VGCIGDVGGSVKRKIIDTVENLLDSRWTTEYIIISLHLLSALLAGGLIGLERSFHGRPAGFRTHALVSIASALLMLVTVYQSEWMTATPLEAIRTDPTRMAQGIMTGIGFLGAGVIYKEGFSVRGLTTAGSIWITAAIGILFGIGFYFPAILSTVLTLGILSIFRHIESRMPSQLYAHHHIKFDRDNVMTEEQLRDLMAKYDFSIAHVDYRLLSEGEYFEYRMVIRTTDPTSAPRLASYLCALPQVREFRISPTGD